MKSINEKSLSDMLVGLAESFSEERKKEQPWKDLFKNSDSLGSLFRELETQMSIHAIDAIDILKDAHGIYANKKQFNFLMALPFLVHVAISDAENKEGSACSVDKAFNIIVKEFKRIGNDE